MQILVSPQEFKGSLSAREAAEAIARGLCRALPDAILDVVPMADGGPGTVDAVLSTASGRRQTAVVQDPLGRPVDAVWGLIDEGPTAVIEMAAASGLVLLRDEERDPRRASTYGTGQLVLAALDAGCRRLIVGVGGSATNDGGAGMAQALGARLLDSEGRELPPGGGPLAGLDHIDVSGLDRRLRDCEVTVAADAENPLCGPTGASRVYGPQKGATPEAVEELEAALASLRGRHPAGPGDRRRFAARRRCSRRARGRARRFSQGPYRFGSGVGSGSRRPAGTAVAGGHRLHR